MKKQLVLLLIFILFAGALVYAVLLADLSPDMNSFRTTYYGDQTTMLHDYKAHLSNDTDNIIWFIQVTDAHIGAYTLTGNNRKNFRDFLASIQYINPSFIADTGDLTNGKIPLPVEQDVNQWADRYNILATANMINTSFYYDLPGNHDGYGDSLTFSYFKNWSVQKQLQYTWNRTLPSGNGNYTFIALNGVQDSGASFPDGTSGDLNQTELDWFEQELIAAQSSNMTMVFAHNQEHDVENHKSTSGKTFLQLIEEYNVSAFIFGHGHENDERNQGGTLCVETDSIGQSFQENGYRIFAIDNDGISNKFQPLNTWPAVVITCPIDRELTMQAFDIPNDSTAVPIRALVFDKTAITTVQYKIDNGNWNSMAAVPGNSYLWNATFNASAYAEGEYTITVRATSPSGTMTDSITIRIGSTDKPEIINGLIPDFIRIENCEPWILNLSMYEFDSVDLGPQLNWSVSGVDASLCAVVITDITNNLVVFTPVQDAVGTMTITFTVNNTRGEEASQTVRVRLVGRMDQSTFQLGLGLILIGTVVGIVVLHYIQTKSSQEPMKGPKK